MIATQNPTSDLRLHRAALAALALLPLALLVLNRHWICNLLCRDHWIYFGYYQHLPELLAQFPDAYFGTRLTIILPGWLAYRFLPPQLANDVLHLGLCYSVLFPLYIVMRGTLGTRTALLSSFFLGCHWYFLCAVGGDYGDGYGLAYTSLSLLMFTIAARTTSFALRQFWLLGAGAALAALVIANLIYFAIVPPLLLNYLLLSRQSNPRSWHGYAADACSIFAGGVCLVAALGIANRQFGGRFLFLMPSFNFGGVFLRTHGTNPFKAPLLVWAPHATWMLLPMLALAGSLWSLALNIRHRQSWVRDGNYQLVFLPLALGLIALNCLPQFCLLQMWLYATPLLLVWSVLALAQQWRLVIEAMSARRFAMVLGLGGTLMVLSVWLRTGAENPISPPPALTLTVALGLIVLCTLASTQFRTQLRAQHGATLAFAVLLAAGNLWARQSFDVSRSVPNNATDEQVRNTRRLTAMRRDCFAAANDVIGEIHAQATPYSNCSFWFNMREPNGFLYDSIACTNLARTIVGMDFPNPHCCGQPFGADFLAGRTIAVMSSDPRPRELLESYVAGGNLKVEVLSERLIHRRAIRFNLLLVRIAPK